MKESGIFYPDGSFKSRKDLMNQSSKVIFETPLPSSQDFTYWNQRFIDRQVQYNETAEHKTNHVVMSFSHKTCINFIGDIHAGSPNVNYERISQELNTIVATPDSYVMLMGDIIDGFFWGQQAQYEEMEQVPEQIQYYHAMLKFLSQHKKLLIGWGGQHDTWAKKMGISANTYFSQMTGAYYMEGIGYVTAKVKGQEYHITGQHRFPGSSIYNPVHGPRRALNEAARGSDVIVGADSHTKGSARIYVDEYGGVTRPVDLIIVGPYKDSDEYSRNKLGFVKQQPEKMFGSAVIFDDKAKNQIVYDDILEANRQML